MKAMILAAGKGTRLKHLTNNRPKALVELNGKPLLGILIEKLKKEGFDHILINIHHFGELIVNYITKNNNFGIKVEFSDERDRLLDTGGAILKAANFFEGDQPVLIHNVDIFSDIKLKPVLESFKRGDDIANLLVRKRNTKRYLLFDEKMYLAGWTDKRTNSFKHVKGVASQHYNEYAFSGIWFAKPQFVKLIPYKGAFSIVDAWLEIARQNKIKGIVDNSALWRDAGTPENLSSLEILLKKQNI